MITYFEAHNFKSIKHLKLHMRDFMVLVGPNGAGKTNVVKAMEVFGAVIRAGTTDPVRDVGYDQLIRREQRPAKAGMSFELHLEIPAHVIARSLRVRQDSAAKPEPVTLELSLGLSGSVTSEDVRVKRESVTLRNSRGTFTAKIEDNAVTMNMGNDPALAELIVPSVFLREIELARSKRAPQADRAEATKTVIESMLTHEEDTEQRVLRLFNWQRMMSPWTRYLRDSVEVTRLRLDSSALRTESAVDLPARSLLIGPNGEGLAAAVSKLRGRGAVPEPQFNSVLQALQRVFPRIEDVATERMATGRLILSFKERGIKDPLGQVNVSDGVLHALALLLAIEGGLGGHGLLAVEEPENAIHPWSTRAMIQRAQEIRNRRQLLITTHSETVVNAVNDPASLFVVEHSDDRGTQVTSAIDREVALGSILRESGQKLGDLWIDGSIGGVPQNSDDE